MTGPLYPSEVRKLLGSVAARIEDYSDFGGNLSGKLALRYDFNDSFALRGSVSTGFRAPTPGQSNTSNTSQGLDTRTLQIFTRGRLSTNDPVAIALERRACGGFRLGMAAPAAVSRIARLRREQVVHPARQLCSITRL